MNKKLLIKTVLLFLAGCFFVVTQTTSVNATPKPDENKVIITESITNVDTVYDTYRDNTFELVTKEREKGFVMGSNEVITNASATIKTFVQLVIKGLGEFNAVMIKTLSSMDIITAIKQPIMNLTSSITTNILGIAGTIGVAFVFVILGVKLVR